MKTILVCCDFRGDAEAESYITGELNKFNGIRFKADSWLLASEVPAPFVMESISFEMRQRVYILIAEVDGKILAVQNRNIESWIKSHCL